MVLLSPQSSAQDAKCCCLLLLLAVPAFAVDRTEDASRANSFLAATHTSDPAPAALQLGHVSQKHQRSKKRTNAIHDWRKRISAFLDTKTESPLLSLLQQPALDVSSSKEDGPYPLASMNEKDAIITGKHKATWKKVGDAQDMQIAFDAFDKDHDHGISLAEFSQLVEPLVDGNGKHMKASPEFNAWDDNGDGRIDLKEFSAALDDAKIGHEYGDVFKSLTMHGPIDRKKLAKLLNHELHGRADMTDEQLDAILTEYGGVPKGHPALSSLAQLTPIIDSIVAFQLVDRDDNGYLSGPELSSFLRTMNPGTPDGTVLLQADEGPGDEDGNGQIGFFDFFTLTHLTRKT